MPIIKTIKVEKKQTVTDNKQSSCFIERPLKICVLAFLNQLQIKQQTSLKSLFNKLSTFTNDHFFRANFSCTSCTINKF